MIRWLPHSFLFGLLMMSEMTQMAFGAINVPNGFTVQQITNSLRSPTTMAFSPDGRLFVCEQGGALRVIKNNILLAKPFLKVTVDSLGERGLLGVTFDPNFLSTPYVYIYYTATTPSIHNRISRFTADNDTALAGSEVVILDLDNLSSATNHNGGAIHFGPDGKLYIAVGDNTNSSSAQLLTSLLGKMLRINADGSIPTNNPFYATTSGNRRAIWAYGLRNPFTFSFQKTTGKIFINDVGQNLWEEINEGAAGANYGWPATEGYTSNPSYLGPAYSYAHGTSDSTGCAITGGDFYNPVIAQFPSSFIGNYFYADYCGGWIRTFHPSDSTTSLFATGLLSPVDVHVDTAGSLFYLARGNGAVARIQYTPNLPPTFFLHPQDVTVTVGDTAKFSVSVTGDPPITYQWQKNNVNIPNANSTTYSLSNTQLSDSGSIFRCIAANTFGSTPSSNAILSVVSNLPPVSAITGPSPAMRYRGGDTVYYVGTGTDPEQGILPSSAFTWQVDFHHDEHLHPFVPATSGSTSGSFIIPVNGETSDTVWFRILLTVSDSGGLSSSTFLDIFPQKSTDTLVTNPPGLSLLLDGLSYITPSIFIGVVGIERALQAPTPQVLNGQSYYFLSWSDGGAASHVISTPAINSAFNATFLASPGVPVLFSPANLATNIPLSPTLRWHSSTDASGYRLQLSTDSTFALITLQDSLLIDTIRVVSGLNPSTRYFWRVRGETPDGFSAYSATASFTTLIAAPSLSIVTTSPLSTRIAGIIFQDTLLASGGTLPYSWSILSGTLPVGVTLSSNGIISGRADSAGSYTFTVQVTDGAAANETKAFSLTVNNPLPSTSSISPTSKTKGEAGFSITVRGMHFVPSSIVQFDGVSRTTLYISDSVVTASLPAVDLNSAGAYNITVNNLAPGGGVSNSQIFTVKNPVANLRVFFQGPFVGGSMTTTLRTSGMIPLVQPYASAPWNYPGSESVVSIPANVVDWVLLELRSGTSVSTIVARRAGFVKDNGTIVDTDGTSPVVFTSINAGNYYVVLRHRNHLAVMSSTTILLDGESILYDFSTGTGKYFGGEAKNLGGGIFGVYSGDYSQDGFIDSDDFIGPDNDIFKSGYRRSDLNLDGFVDSDDFISPDNNVFKSTMVPN